MLRPLHHGPRSMYWRQETVGYTSNPWQSASHAWDSAYQGGYEPYANNAAISYAPQQAGALPYATNAYAAQPASTQVGSGGATQDASQWWAGNGARAASGTAQQQAVTAAVGQGYWG